MSPRAIGVVLFLATAALRAQTGPGRFELSPVGGYLFGGTVLHDDGTVGLDLRGELEDHASYGLRAGYALSSGWEPELEWTAVETDLRVSTGTEFPTRTDYVLAGAAFNLGTGFLRPYAGLAVGAARISGEFPTAARFAGRVSLGAKAFLTHWLALRIELAGYATRLGETAYGVSCTTFSDSDPGVPVSCMNTWLLNANVGGGLVFAF